MTTAEIPIVVVGGSVSCAACGRPLTDEVSQTIGMGECCRSTYKWRHISSLAEETAKAVRLIIHQIADDRLRGDELRHAIFYLYELGFVELSQRIESRLGRYTVTVEAQAPAPPPAVNQYAQPQPEVVRPLPFQPTPHQERALDAVRTMLKTGRHGVVFIVGFAGTGKTSSLQFIAHEHGRPVVITPTGKAALRVREATGLDAMTIHRWIYKPVEDPKTGVTTFKRREGDIPVPSSRLIILDEASMVGPDLWADIYTICSQYDLRLIVIGDGFQLPPVMPPNTAPFSVLTPEFAAQLQAPRVELTEVLRQAEGSPVIRASMMLRNGAGWSAVRDLPQATPQTFWQIAHATHLQGGITICHKNVTRQQINAGMRTMLGIQDELPQMGEPLVCLKNTYEAGLVNGETIRFPGWRIEPGQFESVKDRWKGTDEAARFGGVVFDDGAAATLAIEELHGRLQASPKAVQIAAAKWARLENFYVGDQLAPHVSANFGYAWTAHKAQGSDWPYVLIMLEPSIRLNEDEGRRWCYTSLTRARLAAAIYPGRL